jgi:lipoprotein-anchoring transpeptidase ErfK/SrfK
VDEQPIQEQGLPPPMARRRRRGLPAFVVLLLVLLVLVGIGAALVAHFGGYAYTPGTQVAFAAAGDPPTAKELSQLERKLASYLPRGVFIVVDTVDNRLRVQKGDDVLRVAKCSAGTGSVLEDPKTGKRWVFDSPRGVRRVKEKKKDPVWTKPEWALVEEGLDPAKTPWSDRIDKNTLGDFALYLGDGYMIHGTLYQRYLGYNVTHGCIRLGDADLEYVYQTTPIGASVYMY